MTTIERNVDLSSTAVRSLAEAGGQAKRLFGCSHSKAPLGCIEYFMNIADLELVIQAPN